MIIKVSISQCAEVHYFTTVEFCLFLIGLCAAGRIPELHITPSKFVSKSFSTSSERAFDYYVLIVFNNQ